MTQRHLPMHALRGVTHRRQRMLTLLTLLVSAAVALSALPDRPIQAASAPDTSVATGLDAYLTALSAQHRFSGTIVVARRGTILLSKGYGQADRARRLPNTPLTRFPIGGVTSSFSLLGTLWLEEHGKLADGASICRYVAACPAAWTPITIHMLLDGTANLPNVNWERAGATLAQSLAQLKGQQLDGIPGSRIDYQNAENLVEGTIIETVTKEPWAAFLQQAIFTPAGTRNSGRVTDALLPPARAQDYSGAGADPIVGYNDYYAAYATAPDVYAYDTALFGGTLVSSTALSRLFTPRTAITPGDPGVSDLRIGYKWRIGQVAGHRAIYTNDTMYSFSAINMRFPSEGVTIVVISNDGQNDVEAIAVQSAARVFGVTAAAPPRTTPRALPGATPRPARAAGPSTAPYATTTYTSSAFHMRLTYPVGWTLSIISSANNWGQHATLLSPTTLDISAPDGTDGFDTMAGPTTLSVATLIALQKHSDST